MFRRQGSQEEDDWISVSDLMSALMMIFLFIAISFMSSVKTRADQVKQIAVAYQELQDSLYEDLQAEFRRDLPMWQAEIDKETLSVRFKEPEVLFEVGRATVRPRFEEILQNFFPRYLGIIRSPKYDGNIEEIRIEGHTSSEWTADSDPTTSYFSNMKLSQDRTRAVLQLCLTLISEGPEREWARSYLTANGLSSSRPIRDDHGEEDPGRSRRVEFRTKTAAEKRVVEILREVER